MFVVMLTVPVVNYEEDKHNWNRHLSCLQIVLGSVFGVIGANSKALWIVYLYCCIFNKSGDPFLFKDGQKNAKFVLRAKKKQNIWPLFYRRIKYGYEFGCVWSKSRVDPYYNVLLNLPNPRRLVTDVFCVSFVSW